MAGEPAQLLTSCLSFQVLVRSDPMYILKSFVVATIVGPFFTDALVFSLNVGCRLKYVD